MAEARWRNWWQGALLPVGFIVLAEAFIDLSGFRSDSIAAPSAALLAWVEAAGDGSLARSTGQTIAAAFSGLFLGGGIGLLFGLLLGSVRVLDRLMEFTIEALRPIPSVALIPIALLVYGFGYRMEISIVTFACLWPMLILTRSAIAGVDPKLLEVARVLRFGFAARVWKFTLPAILPRIFVAFRLTAGVSLIVAVTCEIAANPLGLGYGMMSAEQSLRPELMLALLLWIGVVGWTLNHALVRTQRRLFGAFEIAPR